MSDTLTEKQEANGARSPEFPYLTVLASLLTLFLFVALMLLAYYSPSTVPPSTAEDQETLDPVSKLAEIKAKNQAVLEGRPETGTQMSVDAAVEKLLNQLRSETDIMPFPKPLPLPPPDSKAKDKDKK
jgi:biopolymer transport protein ExbD